MSSNDTPMHKSNDAEQYQSLLRRANGVSSQAEIESLARHLQDLAPALDLRPARLALLGSFTLHPLVAHLTVSCHQAGLMPEIYVGPYGQFRQQILGSDGDLYHFAPHSVFLAVELEALLPGVADLPFASPQVRQEAIEQVINALDNLAQSFCQQSQGPLVIHNFMQPTWSPYGLLEGHHPGSLGSWYRELNARLDAMGAGTQQVFILDLDGIAAIHGRAQVSDPRLRYLAHMVYSEGFLSVLAHAYMAYIKAFYGLTRKCIVLDLDNTLWGGIVGEDGVGGLQLGPTGLGQAFVDFQTMLLQLHTRGIILAICSKNNEFDAMRVLREHPHMVLRPEHFAAWRINWQDKITNLRELAREINIGLDAMVFLDDSPAERFLVREALPQVLVPDLTEDPAFYPQALARLNDFSTLVLTAEDQRRGQDYAAQRARRALESESGSLEEFLTGLETVAEVQRADGFSLPRLAQLTQRTNQFNLTTRRYSLPEIESLSANPSVRLYSLRVSDRFGDSGIVGCAIVRCGSDCSSWCMDTFLLSCRVIGRSVETAFLTAIAADLQAHGACILVGQYIPSDKNGLVADFFPQHGFRLRQSDPDGHTWWELSLTGTTRPAATLAVPAHVTLKVGPSMPLPPVRESLEAEG